MKAVITKAMVLVGLERGRRKSEGKRERWILAKTKLYWQYIYRKHALRMWGPFSNIKKIRGEIEIKRKKKIQN